MVRNPTSSFRLGGQALLESFKLLWPVLKRAWLPLIALHLVQVFVGAAFEKATELLFDLGREDLLLLALLALTQIVFTVMWTGAWLVVLLTTCRNVLQDMKSPAPRFMDEMIHFYNHVMIEQVRALASVIWRIPLLIVPALVRYVRLSFVPLLVILDPQYSFGQVEALKTSSDLSRGRFWLLFVVLVISLSAPVSIETLLRTDQIPPWISALWASPFTLFVNLLLGTFLFSVFRKVTMISNLNPLPSPAPARAGMAQSEA